MKEISDYVGGLRLGSVQAYKNMKIVPLLGKSSRLEYIVFDEALDSGLRVTETDSVPTLHFKNETEKNVLILKGEYVLGGKQNRMVAENIYMAKNFDGDVPVRCVEQGRWNFDFDDGYRPSPPFDPLEPIGPPVFYSSRRMVSRGLVSEADEGQGQLWEGVRCLMVSNNVSSPTQDLGDLFDEKQGELEEFVSHFEYVPRSVGMMVATKKNGQIRYGVDIFDKSKTIKHFFGRLLESYVVDMLSSNERINRSKKDMEDFLNKIHNSDFMERRPISLGKNFNISGNGMQGSVLVYNSKPLYLAFNTSKRRPRRRNPDDLDRVYPGRRSGFTRIIY